MTAVEVMGVLARRLPQSRWKSYFFRVASRLMVTLGCEPVARSQLNDGTSLLLDARSRTEATALWNGSYDSDELEFMRRSITASSTFLDIGANIGLIAVPISRFLSPSGGRVIAVEPVRVNAARLRASSKLNGDLRLDVVELALGSASGVVRLSKEGAASSSGNAIVAATGETARLETLDAVLAEMGGTVVSFIKIDVEGYELSVLQGALETLKRYRPIIYGEFHSGLMPKFQADFTEVESLLSPLGYRYYKFTGKCTVEEVKPASGIGNVVLVPTEKVSQWLTRLALPVIDAWNDRA